MLLLNRNRERFFSLYILSILPNQNTSLNHQKVLSTSSSPLHHRTTFPSKTLHTHVYTCQLSLNKNSRRTAASSLYTYYYTLNSESRALSCFCAASRRFPRPSLSLLLALSRPDFTRTTTTRRGKNKGDLKLRLRYTLNEAFRGNLLCLMKKGSRAE